MYANWALETFLFFIIFILRFTRGLHGAIFCLKMRISGTDKKCLQNVQKVLDLCGFYGYYMSRYSGIVQSVEQRTVKIPEVLSTLRFFHPKKPQISADFFNSKIFNSDIIYDIYDLAY